MIPFAMGNNGLIHATETIDCSCNDSHCVACGVELESHISCEGIPYFHHAGGDCGQALRKGILHFMSEALIRQRLIVLPKLEKAGGIVSYPWRWHFSSIEIGSNADSWDLLLRSVSGHYGIVVNTHGLVSPKTDELRRQGVPSVEIDLRFLAPFNYPGDMLEDCISDARGKRWVYHPRLQAGILIESLGVWQDVREELSLEGTVPTHLNAEIVGDQVFECARTLWQSALFRDWVLYSASPGPTIHIKDVVEWILSKPDYYPLSVMSRKLSRPELRRRLAGVVTTFFDTLEDSRYVRRTKPYDVTKFYRCPRVI